MSAGDIERYLRTLGYGDNSQIIIASKGEGKPFHGTVCKGIKEAVQAVQARTAGEVWITVNEMRPVTGGRGLAVDVVRLAALWVDLDFKPEGVIDEAGARAVIDGLTEWVGVPPAMIVFSGGGMQPYWPITDGTDMAEAALLLRRWHVLVDRVAAKHGYAVDALYDLPRVLRAPGSFNRKTGQPRTVTVEWDSGGEAGYTTIGEFHDILTDAEIPMPSAPSGEGVPVEEVTLSGWLTDGTPCQVCLRSLSQFQRDREGNLHGSTLRAVGELLRAGERGHRGVAEALRSLQSQFMHEAMAGGSSGKVRTQDMARQEWREMFRSDFLRSIASQPTPADKKGCCGANAANHSDWRADFAELGVVDGPPPNVDPETGEIYDPIATLFSASPTLRHIRDASLSRMTSPLATLACCIAITAAAIPTEITLPAIAGPAASLNLGVMLVGRSGGGKSNAWATAEDLLPEASEQSFAHDAGSGEGLIAVFVGSQGRDLVRTQVRMYVDELSQMHALGARSGSTLMPTLRSMVMGNQVGNGNAQKDRDRHLDRLSYRFCAVIGTQPGTAAPLLSNEEVIGGTPQRFWWVGAEITNDQPIGEQEWPGPLEWLTLEGLRQQQSDALHGLVQGAGALAYPDGIAEFIVEQRKEYLFAADPDPLHSHAVLLRLKLAAAMAHLHNRYGGFNEWDWWASGVLMDHHWATIEKCKAEVSVMHSRTNEAIGRANGERQIATTATIEDHVLNDVKKRIVAITGLHGQARCPEGCIRRCYQSGMSTKEKRKAIPSAVEQLVSEGRLVQEKARYQIPL